MIEDVSRIEPCLFDGDVPATLVNLSVDLQKEAAALGADLHPRSRRELRSFVRLMNCYFSNLIEGHKTKPKDIERVLMGLSVTPEKRPLLLEAKAHIQVQAQIDEMHDRGVLPSPFSAAFAKTLHRCFYLAVPDELRRVGRSDGSFVGIVPGEFRSDTSEDVIVGRHHPPSSDRVDAFMAYFETRFSRVESQSGLRLVALAAAHHRFNYVHPFVDGNGRVSRLMSYAGNLKYGIGADGLWSISRGMARGLEAPSEYKMMMDHADMPRQGSLDGRGNLSKRTLTEFCEWFLSVSLDQIRFSRVVFDFDRLEGRLRSLAQDVVGDKRSADLVAAVFRYGEVPRGDASFILKTSDRTARSSISDLVDAGLLRSDGPKTPVRVAFPSDHRERLFPSLFTDTPIEAPSPPSPSFPMPIPGVSRS